MVLQNEGFGVIIDIRFVLIKILIKRAIIFVLLGLLIGLAQAQVLPRCGTHFTFGIPEGPDALVDPTLGTGISDLFVNIVSEHDGKGLVTSPSGYCQEFSFSANTVLKLDLPYNLMHMTDLGKTNKGILIRTSQPANVTFHDFLADAGEATQIYPDEALDTNYRITSWGIFDDPGEDNHSEFIITATHDSTNVTIIPSINTLGNHPANVPIHVSLNRGECYIVKSDITDLPFETTLSKSIVTSTYPVSIITAISCGYNPLGIESCNEMLDEVLPRRITDTIFYVTPILGPTETNIVLFTSETQSFWVSSSNGIPYQASNGRVQVPISSPDVFTLTAPAQCFILTQGSEVSDEGDPTIATVLPPGQYTDTMLWFTPNFMGAIFFQPAPFENFISVLYPTASENQVLLDGIPITTTSTPQPINSSLMSGVIVSIDTGIHRLISPVPIFAIAGGFADADGYSFIPGTTAPVLRIDTFSTSLKISTTNAKTCSTFDAKVNSVFRAVDGISSVDLTITYDQNLLTLVSASLGPAAQGGQWTIDSRIPGVIKLSASCLAPYSDSDALVLMTFSTGPTITTTTITGNMNEMGGEELFTAFAGTTTNNVIIHESRDTIPTALFSVNAGHAVFGSYDTATVSLIHRLNEVVTGLDLYVTYNHDLLSLLVADFRNTLIPGLTTITPTPFDQFTDKIQLKFTPALNLNSAGVIVRLLFQTYISDSSSGNIQVHTSFLNSQPCPLGIFVEQDSGKFTGIDTCGTSLLRSEMAHLPLQINSVIPNPSNGSFIIDIDRHVFAGEPVHLSLFDMLGNEVWNTDYLSSSINQKISCMMPSSVSAGSYFLRASIIGHVESQKIVIAK